MSQPLSTTSAPRQAYKTIDKAVNCEDDAIKGSRFITLLSPISSLSEAQQVIKNYQQQLPNMRHYCWAYTLHQNGRTADCHFSDDGEPAGSAGKPILAQLNGHALENVIAVVARHFGGTKLGVGGLVRAYSSAVGYAISEANVISITPTTTLTFSFNYNETAVIDSVLASEKITPDSVDYSDKVTMSIKVADDNVNSIKALLIERSADKINFICQAED